MKRVCKKCGVEKDLEEFVKNKSCKYGMAGICKECANKAQRNDKTRERDRKRYNKRFIYCTQCATCFGFFMARNRATKYCTQYCAGIAKKGIQRPKHVMNIMKKTWIKKRQRISQKTEFKKGESVGHKWKKGHVPWNDSGTFIKCDFCGKKFKAKPHAIKKSVNHFCSKECSDKFSYKGGIASTVKELREVYVKKCISQTANLKSEDITPEMIELKREIIQYKRVEKELNNVINR